MAQPPLAKTKVLVDTGLMMGVSRQPVTYHQSDDASNQQDLDFFPILRISDQQLTDQYPPTIDGLLSGSH